VRPKAGPGHYIRLGRSGLHAKFKSPPITLQEHPPVRKLFLFELLDNSDLVTDIPVEIGTQLRFSRGVDEKGG
jgi:hypothetical protein